MSTITLGYEMKTGREVRIPIRHTAVTGQSQESGKTTTLEALIGRSGLRAVAFVTKRGERSFMSARVVAPYFKEPECSTSDPMWQYVKSILEATLQQGMRFQESWIMKVCDSYDRKDGKWEKARTLTDVAANLEIAIQKARGLNESVYTQLREYFRIVLPQIERLPKSDRLHLETGINVMNLGEYTPEMQALVIRSVVDWVTEHESKTIVIIPEAWEFIPQERGSPVRYSCERLIRQGAAVGNYIWIDSQDIAGVHKTILRQIAVWILGVQREVHEVERTLDHIPRPKPSADQIMKLGRGQFYCCHNDNLSHVYVQPLWLSASDAQLVAYTGDRPPEAPRRAVQTLQEKEEIMYQQKFEESQRELHQARLDYEKLKKEMEDYKGQLGETIHPPRDSVTESANGYFRTDKGKQIADSLKITLGPDPFEQMYQYILQRVKQDPAVLAILKAKPTIRVDVVEHTLELNGDTLAGRVALLIHDDWFSEPRTLADCVDELRRGGCRQAPPNVWRQLKDLTKKGFLRNDDKTYTAVKGMRVEKNGS